MDVGHRRRSNDLSRSKSQCCITSQGDVGSMTGAKLKAKILKDQTTLFAMPESNFPLIYEFLLLREHDEISEFARESLHRLLRGRQQ